MTETQNWRQLSFITYDLRDSAYCLECPLNKRESISFVPFEVVGRNPHPAVLFVAEAPFKEEIREQRPLIGPSGTLLRDVLADFLTEYALANITCCHPSNTRLGPQAPDRETREYCVTHIHQFIEQVKPKTVILLGASAIKTMLPDSYKAKVGKEIESVGKMVSKAPERIDGILYACAYHPSYLLRDGGLKSTKCPEYRQRFKDILERVPGQKVSSIHSLRFTSHTFDQLPFILRALESHTDIGLDYETLELDPWSIKNKVTGFSLSVIVDGKIGRSYFIRVDRDPTLGERHILLDFLRRKRIWAYNEKFESNVTWAWLGERILFEDAFPLCKIDCSPLSLKMNAQKYTKAELWEEDVYAIVKYYTQIFEQMEKLSSLFPETIHSLRLGEYEAFREYFLHIDEKTQKKFKKLTENVEFLLELITFDDLNWGLQQYPYPWGAIPYHILGEYCCWDSFLTLQLKDHFWEKYGTFYPYYISQTRLAGTMEAYGYNWDDVKAEELYQYYLTEASLCLFELIQRLDIEDVRKQDANCIFHGNESPQKKLEKLKEIFNPLSNDPKAQAPFWSAYRVPEVETWAFFTYLEHEILQHEDLDDKTFIQALDKNDVNRTARNLYECATTADENAAITSILQRSGGKVAFYFQRFAIEITEFQYEAHTKYGGVNIDKQETWNDQFYMLYYLKRFKKIMKSESTYIRGKIGRDQVFLSTYETLVQPPRRIETYTECSQPHIPAENERWILNANFFENGADTKRWRAGIHTVPAHSELREIYTTRSSSSLMFHVDYAQNEVRFLARLAGEENLLKVIEEGLEIHRYVASRIFKKSMGEVTPTERDWAKAGTFGLLYGKSVVSFAQDMMKGDLEAAQRFFDDFFSAFPGIAAYISSCHKQILRYGFVNTIFGDPIYIDQQRYREDEVLRRAQNYSIQSSASSLAAHAVSLLNEAVIAKSLHAIPLGFCHDAADFEVELHSFLPFVSLMYHYMVDHIRDHYRVPVGVDWSIGIHQNHSMKLSRNHEDASYLFSCPQLTFDKIIARLEQYFVVDYTIENEIPKLQSLSELFGPKGSFSKYIGQNILYYDGTLSLVPKRGKV